MEEAIENEIHYTHEIDVEHYNMLRKSVNWILVKESRARKALSNSFYMTVAEHNGEPVGMARIVSDGGYTYFITDVIVKPEYQGYHIGTELICQLLNYIKRDVMDGETVMVSLMALPRAAGDGPDYTGWQGALPGAGDAPMADFALYRAMLRAREEAGEPQQMQ